MAIQLDQLPQERPANNNEYPLVPEGKQFLKIKEASFKTKQETGSKWIEIIFENSTGSRIYDRVFDSSKPAPQFKLSRLLKAAGIPLSGAIEMQDLAPLLTGKEMYADVKHEENNYYDPPRMEATIDMFSADIFYPITDTPDPVGQQAPETPTTY